ncbi:MAG: hypothetical protein ISR69_06425 [Gammaproteobacteria bacterium]|nr:hypothetical protein [Gammaproteobacteria bacterium]
MKGISLFFILLISYSSITCVSANTISLTTNEIIVLKSKESIYYSQSIQELKQLVGNNANILETNIQQKPLLNDASLIISLGARAAQYSRKKNPDTAKIVAFITLKQSKLLGLKKNEIHLLIEQEPRHYFQFAKTILPTAKFGVLFRTDDHEWINSVKQQPDIQTQFIQITSHSNIIRSTRQIIKKSDVLLALPNKDIFNRHTLKGILLNTFQNKKAFISYSSSHVKAGAIASLYSSTENIGQHIAITLLNMLKTGSAVFNKRFYALYYSVKTNPRVASSLGLKLPSDEEIKQTIQLLRDEND